MQAEAQRSAADEKSGVAFMCVSTQGADAAEHANAGLPAERRCFVRSRISRCYRSMPRCFCEKRLREEKFPTDRNPTDVAKKKTPNPTIQSLISKMRGVHPQPGSRHLLRCHSFLRTSFLRWSSSVSPSGSRSREPGMCPAVGAQRKVVPLRAAVPQRLLACSLARLVSP